MPVIDVATASAAQPAAASLFVYPGSQYDAAGHAVAVQRIAARLAADVRLSIQVEAGPGITP